MCFPGADSTPSLVQPAANAPSPRSCWCILLLFPLQLRPHCQLHSATSVYGFQRGSQPQTSTQRPTRPACKAPSPAWNPIPGLIQPSRSCNELPSPTDPDYQTEPAKLATLPAYAPLNLVPPASPPPTPLPRNPWPCGFLSLLPNDPSSALPNSLPAKIPSSPCN